MEPGVVARGRFLCLLVTRSLSVVRSVVEVGSNFVMSCGIGFWGKTTVVDAWVVSCFVDGFVCWA